MTTINTLLKESTETKGRPAFCIIAEKGKPEQVVSWMWDERWLQSVPAIEASRITVVKFPVDYYQHFHYSPEATALRRERRQGFGGSRSFDLPRPPVTIGCN